MIQNINSHIQSASSLLEIVHTGLLVFYKKESGYYLMLSKNIQTFIEKPSTSLRGDRLGLYSIHEDHPLFYKVYRQYNIKQLPAILIIKNDVLLAVMSWPIYNSTLQETLSILDCNEKI